MAPATCTSSSRARPASSRARPASSRGRPGTPVSGRGLAGVHGLGGLADDKLRLEDDLMMLVGVGGGGLVEEHPGGGAAELLSWLAHRGERNGGRSREVDVVI